jgi:hypothetical protein
LVQVTIQTHRTTARFFTGIAFVLCASADLFCGLEAINVAAAHSTKQNNTTAIFISKLMAQTPVFSR